MLRYVRHVKYSWRVDESWMAVERPPAVEREFDRSFADEIAIDFPAVGDKVARMRHAFVATDVVIDWLRAEISLSRRQAGAGAAKCGTTAARRARDRATPSTIRR